MLDTEDAAMSWDLLFNYPSFLQWQESTAILILNCKTEKQGSNYPIKDKIEIKTQATYFRFLFLTIV